MTEPVIITSGVWFEDPASPAAAERIAAGATVIAPIGARAKGLTALKGRP